MAEPMHAAAAPTASAGLRHEARRLAVLARVAFVLMAFIVMLSTFVRERGAACEPQPHCLTAADEATAVVAARLAHRAAAAAVLAIVVSIVFVAGPRRRAAQREFRLAASLLSVVLLLAALGVAASGAAPRFAAVGNLVGGFAMLALAAPLAWTALTGRLRLLGAALLPWLLAIGLGSGLARWG